MSRTKGIRNAEPRHEAAIDALLRDAFDGDAEARLVAEIRKAGLDRVSIVHETDGRVDGYCLLSQLRAPSNCLALGPVAVSADQRKLGLGNIMVKEGINRAVSNAISAIFVLGDPAYYSRFGFSLDRAAPFSSPWPRDYFQILELEDGASESLAGEVSYAEPFDMFLGGAPAHR